MIGPVVGEGVGVGVGVGVVVGRGVWDGVDDGDVVGVLVGVTGLPVHATPLSVNAVGAGLLPAHAPLKPNDAVPLVATFPFHPALRTDTAAPDWVTEPFHSWLTVWPAPNEKRRSQAVTGSPRLVTLTSAPKPLCHWLVTL